MRFFSRSARSRRGGDGDLVAEAIAELRRRGLRFMKGWLLPPKGQPVEDWEDREQTLFKSTALAMTLTAPDEIGRFLHLFCVRYRLSQDQDRQGLRVLIDVWGADHGVM